jgi:hypothetical protein
VYPFDPPFVTPVNTSFETSLVLLEGFTVIFEGEYLVGGSQWQLPVFFVLSKSFLTDGERNDARAGQQFGGDRRKVVANETP